MATLDATRRGDRARQLADDDGRVLTAVESGAQYSTDIWRVARLPVPRLYRGLARLETAGLIVAGWDDNDPPRRTYLPA